MSWISALNNQAGIDAVYQGNPPDLKRVHVHEVNLHQDGPTLKLRIDLPHYPAQPPRKWAAQGFNTVQVEISFGGIKQVTLDGFGTNIVADVSLHAEDGIDLVLTSPELHLHATAEVAFISKLGAYTNEPNGY
ncbi:Imm50 family immunity protein [Streptomyces sp. NPDC012751]|uniref:Imm50 family immunity protein n=1 Tax=Streptomyces sp. NPDC012751 TaxID=3364846 RepID=UPI0036B03A69